jgi:DNA-binding CsgD family transcriptional regulator
VRTHVSNILAKLEAPNRSAAAAKYQMLQAVRG